MVSAGEIVRSMDVLWVVLSSYAGGIVYSCYTYVIIVLLFSIHCVLVLLEEV